MVLLHVHTVTYGVSVHIVRIVMSYITLSVWRRKLFICTSVWFSRPTFRFRCVLHSQQRGYESFPQRLNSYLPTCALLGITFWGLLATLSWLQDTIEHFLVSNMLNSEHHIAAKQIKFLGEKCISILVDTPVLIPACQSGWPCFSS